MEWKITCLGLIINIFSQLRPVQDDLYPATEIPAHARHQPPRPTWSHWSLWTLVTTIGLRMRRHLYCLQVVQFMLPYKKESVEMMKTVICEGMLIYLTSGTCIGVWCAGTRTCDSCAGSVTQQHCPVQWCPMLELAHTEQTHFLSAQYQPSPGSDNIAVVFCDICRRTAAV